MPMVYWKPKVANWSWRTLYRSLTEIREESRWKHDKAIPGPRATPGKGDDGMPVLILSEQGIDLVPVDHIPECEM